MAKALVTPELEQAARRYNAALSRGRVATAKRDYAAAEKAFSDALEVRGPDAVALAERGYARYLAGNLAGADEDFRSADGRTADRRVAAQIFFNQGLVAEALVEEGRGDIETAQVAFARSQEAFPTRAAAARLELLKSPGCTAFVRPLTDSLQHYATWTDVWKKLREGDAPSTDAEIMSDLEIEGCEIACAVTLGGYDWSVVVPAAQGFDVLWKVDSGQWYRCGGPPKFEFERKGNILRIASGNTEQLLMPCDSDDKACPGESCVTGPSHRYDTFIDLGTKRAIVRVSQNIPETDLSKNLWEHFLPVTFDETQVSIVGGKCNRQYRFTPQGSHI